MNFSLQIGRTQTVALATTKLDIIKSGLVTLLLIAMFSSVNSDKEKTNGLSCPSFPCYKNPLFTIYNSKKRG